MDPEFFLHRMTIGELRHIAALEMGLALDEIWLVLHREGR